MQAKISVIIPAYNAAAHLKETLDSVFDQSLAGSLEVIVYDDGSTDGTAAVLDAYPRPLRRLGETESRGANHGRNRAAEVASGRYLAFLDSDDLWLPDKLRFQWELMEETDEPAIVFGQMQEFDENGPRGDYRDCNLTSVCFTSREVFQQVGPFDEGLRLGDFAEWLSRAQDLGIKFLVPKVPMARRRLHAENSGRRLQEHRSDYLEVVRRRLARKREQK